jgi:hypothetical protein
MTMDSRDYPEIEGHHPIEPTQQVTPSYTGDDTPHTQPYLSTGYLDDPYIIAPPPPPESYPRRAYNPLVVLTMLLILGIVLFAIAGLYYLYSPRAVQPSATQQPTVKPTLYTAEEIYNAFAAAGLGGTLDTTPDYWPCCLYRPEGGYVRWERQDGSSWEVASFINSQEAEGDAFSLNKSMDGPGWAESIHNCLLTGGPLSNDLIPHFKTIMAKYCH